MRHVLHLVRIPSQSYGVFLGECRDQPRRRVSNAVCSRKSDASRRSVQREHDFIILEVQTAAYDIAAFPFSRRWAVTGVTLMRVRTCPRPDSMGQLRCLFRGRDGELELFPGLFPSTQKLPGCRPLLDAPRKFCCLFRGRDGQLEFFNGYIANSVPGGGEGGDRGCVIFQKPYTIVGPSMSVISDSVFWGERSLAVALEPYLSLSEVGAAANDILVVPFPGCFRNAWVRCCKRCKLTTC